MGVTYNPRIITDGLVLAFDAGNTKSYPGSGTTWTDLSGNGNNGTLTNGPTYSSSNGGSLSFDGTNDYVETNYTQTSILSYTIEAWAKIPTNVSNAVSFSQNRGSGAGKSLTLGITGAGGGPSATVGYLFFVMDTNLIGLGPYYTGKKYNDNIWHQFVGTIDIPTNTSLQNNETTYIKLYADGNLLQSPLSTWSAIFGTVPLSPFTGLGNMRIGWHEAWTRYASANISKVSIYNRALTASEVQQNFNALRGRYGI